MAGLTLAQRDLAETREQLRTWVEYRFGPDTTLSELTTANRAAGWSSETYEPNPSWIGSHLSMFKMACRILRTKVLLRRLGLTDHAFLRAPIPPSWAVETIHG